MRIENESGIFMIDEAGSLIDFIPSEENFIEKKPTTLRHLIFPDEIKIIPELTEHFAFRELVVTERIVFPTNLVELGSYSFDLQYHGIFSWSKLPDIVLPKTLKVLGNFAFGKSDIRSIDLHNYKYQYGRQFKGAHIGTWYLSNLAPKDAYIMGSMRFNDQIYDSIVEY